MATADTSKTALRFMEETSWGVLPATGKLQELRTTGENLVVERQTTTSEEMRPDRQVPDLIQTHVDAQGSINGELSYGSYDEFIEGLMGNNWGATIDTTQSSATPIVGATVVDGKLRIPIAEVPAGIAKGMALSIAGFTGATTLVNNRIAVVTAINDVGDPATAQDFTVSPALVNKGTATSISLKGSFLSNGQVEKSYTIEKDFTDVDKLLVYRGMVPSTFSMEVESESKVTVTFNFMGKNGEIVTNSVNPDGLTNGEYIFNPASTTTIMSSGVQDGTIIQGGNEASFIKAITLNIDNSVRGKTAIGTIGNVDIGKGRFTVTGSISTYFRDFSLYQNYLNNTGTSLIFTLTSPGGGTYVFYLPNIKFTAGNVVAGGADEDVMADMDFQALLDENTSKTLFITRID